MTIFRFFKMADGRNVGFLKFQTVNGRTAEDDRNAPPCQIWSKSVKPRPRYGDFSIFQDGGRRRLEFLKFQTFNGRTAQEGRSALSCQIWSNSVKPRRIYGDFSIFQDGGRSYLGFLKFQTLTAGRFKRVEVCRRVTFGRNRSKRGGDMAIFRYFKMAACAILNF